MEVEKLLNFVCEPIGWRYSVSYKRAYIHVAKVFREQNVHHHHHRHRRKVMTAITLITSMYGIQEHCLMTKLNIQRIPTTVESSK